MKKRSSKIKPVVNCPICDKRLIKKYISQHIRRVHKSNDYCSIIKIGMIYRGFKPKNVDNSPEFFFSVVYIIINQLKNPANIIIKKLFCINIG